MSCRERVADYLTEQGAPYQLHHHPSAAFTAQEVAQLENIPGELVAKVVMAIGHADLLMFVIPAPAWLDLAKAASEIGAAGLRLATEDEFASHFPDCEIGATPALGNLYGVPVYADKSLARDGTIFFQAGTHRDVFEMEFDDFARLADATIVDVARHDAA